MTLFHVGISQKKGTKATKTHAENNSYQESQLLLTILRYLTNIC